MCVWIHNRLEINWQTVGAKCSRTGSDWSWNNPRSAVAEFLAKRLDFENVRPPLTFDESQETPECTYHSEGWLRRRL